MISFDDHRKSDGSVDWTSYKNAQIKAGEICYKCKKFIISFFGDRYERLCFDCTNLASKQSETSHSGYIRCPKCRHEMRAFDDDGCPVPLVEGLHTTFCTMCDHEFEVRVDIEFTFTSPPIIESELPNDEED